MPAYLKTIYPCTSCGTPTQVRSRYTAQFARCPDCRETARLDSLLNGYEARRVTHAKQAGAAKPGADSLPLWFEAASDACEVARYAVMVAAREPDIRRKRHLGRLAEGRRKWAESVLRQLAGLLGDERSGWTGHLKLVALPPVEVGETAIAVKAPGAGE